MDRGLWYPLSKNSWRFAIKFLLASIISAFATSFSLAAESPKVFDLDGLDQDNAPSCQTQAERVGEDLAQKYGISVLVAKGTGQGQCRVELTYLGVWGWSLLPKYNYRLNSGDGTGGGPNYLVYDSVEACEADRAHQVELLRRLTGAKWIAAKCRNELPRNPLEIFAVAGGPKLNMYEFDELELEGVSDAERISPREVRHRRERRYGRSGRRIELSG